MKIVVRNLSFPVGAAEEEAVAEAVRRFPELDIKSAGIFRRSVDARHKDRLRFIYSAVLTVSQSSVDERTLAQRDAAILDDGGLVLPVGEETLTAPPVIVGFGPCGMFCALILAECGMKPVVIERGGCVEDRQRAVAGFYSSGVLDENTNIQFGAGGAGTFSDGKLVTRINDRRCGYVIEKLYSLGAPEDILTNARPHIGTDKLGGIVNSADERIRALGGSILYNTRFTGIKHNGGTAYAAVTNAGDIPCGALVIATGHSARDTYAMLATSGFSLEKKPFSVGVRIEHLREDVESAMYGSFAGNPLLPPAEYSLSTHIDGRGVYSFCMCPGGEVTAAASAAGGVVTNGMSRFARNGINSNSAIAVSVLPEDPIGFQRGLEEAAFNAAGKSYAAPVQTLGDFINQKSGTAPSRVKPTYMGGKYELCDLNRILPADICRLLRLGFADFGRKQRGFDAPNAVLTGVETRTSAPLRILRSERLCAVGFDNVYPGGEGAGYSGGITSSAVDGIRVAEELCRKYKY